MASCEESDYLWKCTSIKRFDNASNNSKIRICRIELFDSTTFLKGRLPKINADLLYKKVRANTLFYLLEMMASCEESDYLWKYMLRQTYKIHMFNNWLFDSTTFLKFVLWTRTSKPYVSCRRGDCFVICICDLQYEMTFCWNVQIWFVTVTILIAEPRPRNRNN